MDNSRKYEYVMDLSEIREFTRTTVKILEGQMWTVFRIGDGTLRVARNDCSEIPCREIQFIRRTKRLLMLGYMQSPKRPAWFVMPLRIFGDEQELGAFLDLIRNPQAGDGDGCEEAAEYAGTAVREPGYTAPQEYMRFSYLLDKERWERFTGRLPVTVWRLLYG